MVVCKPGLVWWWLVKGRIRYAGDVPRGVREDGKGKGRDGRTGERVFLLHDFQKIWATRTTIVNDSRATGTALAIR